MNNKFYQDVRGSMTQYAPITPEQVEKEAEGAFTYRELSEFFQEQNLSIKKVIHDPGRMYLNTYYADFDEGLYVAVLLDKEFLQNTVLFLSELNQRQRETFLAEKDWRSFYTISVPLALQIYDFQHRYRDIERTKCLMSGCLYISVSITPMGSGRRKYWTMCFHMLQKLKNFQNCLSRGRLPYIEVWGCFLNHRKRPYHGLHIREMRYTLQTILHGARPL